LFATASSMFASSGRAAIGEFIKHDCRHYHHVADQSERMALGLPPGERVLIRSSVARRPQCGAQTANEAVVAD
jgi:hypothetical protein